MRAIDADHLKRWILSMVFKTQLNVSDVIDQIDRELTIEPERKKGKWIPQDFNKHSGMASTLVYYYPKCSVCGKSANYTNFCPNCGADLRGDDHDL